VQIPSGAQVERTMRVAHVHYWYRHKKNTAFPYEPRPTVNIAPVRERSSKKRSCRKNKFYEKYILLFRCRAVGVFRREVVRAASGHRSKRPENRVPSEQRSDLGERRLVSDLALENLAKRNVDEHAGRQRLEYAIGEIYPRIGLDRFKDDGRQSESDRIHQGVRECSDDDRFDILLHANQLQSETERYHRLVNEVADEDGPHLQKSSAQTESLVVDGTYHSWHKHSSCLQTEIENWTFKRYTRDSVH